MGYGFGQYGCQKRNYDCKDKSKSKSYTCNKSYSKSKSKHCW